MSTATPTRTRSAAASRSRARRPRRRGEAAFGYLMIAPLVVGLAVFYLWPGIRTCYLSFTRSGVFGGTSWVGLANYRALLTDGTFWRALANSFGYTGMMLLGVPLALGVAAMLNQRGLRGVGVYRVLFFVPVVTMPAAVALVWRLLFNGDYGPINAVLSAVGIGRVGWLTDPHTALVALAVVGVWSSLGTNVVIFLAGLQGVPGHLYEAAELDGASRFRQFRSVTVPMVTPTIFLVVVITVINALQVFDLVYVMLGPTNPATEQTQTVVYMFYERAFVDNDQGSAAAIAFLLLIVVFALTAVQFRLQRRWVHYG